MTAVESFMGGGGMKPPTYVSPTTIGDSLRGSNNIRGGGGFRQFNSGAMTANVWKTVVSVNAAGYIHAVLLQGGSNSSCRCRITLDGVLALNQNEPAWLARGFDDYALIWPPSIRDFSLGTTLHTIAPLAAPLRFKSSFLIETLTTATVTGPVVHLAYQTE